MLTDAQIKKLATPGQDQLIPAGDRLGLYLRLRATGRRTWITRRRIGGAWQVQTLGDWPTLTGHILRDLDGLRDDLAACRRRLTLGDRP